MSSKKFLYNIAFSAQLITLTISSQTLPFKRISNPGSYYKKIQLFVAQHYNGLSVLFITKTRIIKIIFHCTFLYFHYYLHRPFVTIL